MSIMVLKNSTIAMARTSNLIQQLLNFLLMLMIIFFDFKNKTTRGFENTGFWED